MSSASLAGIPILEPSGALTSGEAFLLANAPVQDAEAELNQWKIAVRRGVKVVVAYGGSTSSPEATHTAALNAANLGLDYMSVRGLCDVAIKDSGDDYMLWWRNGIDLTLRINTIFSTLFHATATGIAKDTNGKIHPSSPPPPASTHDAFRFVRMSRTSQYLYDSYRNMFLALESLLSDLRPKAQKANGRWEGEGEWFRNAMSEADKLVPVKGLAPTSEPDPVQWIMNTYTVMKDRG